MACAVQGARMHGPCNMAQLVAIVLISDIDHKHHILRGVYPLILMEMRA